MSEVGLLECKRAYTPIFQNHKLGECPDQVPIDKEKYQILYGKVIYHSHTHLDITGAMGIVSPLMHCPGKDHKRGHDQKL